MSSNINSGNKEPSSYEKLELFKRKVRIYAGLVVIALTTLFTILLIKISDQAATWNELKTRSEAHDVLVSAYRGCRTKLFASSSIEECHLVVKEYAELRGLENELPKVLKDIISTSESM